MHAQISTQAAADGSSYLEMGNTKVICSVAGPAEVRGQSGRDRGAAERDVAAVQVEVGIAGFSAIDRKRRGRGDRSGFPLEIHTHSFVINLLTEIVYRRVIQMQETIASTFQQSLFTHLYPHSTISLSIHVLSQDGSLLAACLNAATLALIDAGIPMKDYIAACTCGLTPPAPAQSADAGSADPLLDLNNQEEQELPFLTVATLGTSDKVSVLVMESRLQVGRLESMLAVGVDGCRQIRGILDAVIRERGDRILSGALD